MSHQFCVCAFCSLRLSCRRSNTRRWPNVVLLLAHRLRRGANISPVLGYRVMFDATLHVGQRHRRRASINPAFVQSILRVLQPAWSRPGDYGWVDIGQHRRRWPNIYQTLNRCQLALPYPQPSKHQAGEDAVDIKTGFHHIKIHSLYLSTVQRSYLVTLITKAIDTTSNSYQPLWLRCWRGDISSFF